MDQAKTIDYFDFYETRYVAQGADALQEIPRLSESNFMQLVDEHNSLVEKVNEIIKNTNTKDE